MKTKMVINENEILDIKIIYSIVRTYQQGESQAFFPYTKHIILVNLTLYGIYQGNWIVYLSPLETILDFKI